jgi:cytochrome c-type biogenesis protein CcmH/NrfG
MSLFFFDRRRLKKQARVIFIILIIALSAGLIISSIQWASAPLPVSPTNNQQVSEKEMEKAIKEQITKLEKQVKEAPQDITLMSQLAYMYQMSGDIENGKKFFQQQIDVLTKQSQENPKDAETRLALATAYDIVGDNEKALEGYNKVLELNPDNYDVRLRLASQYFHETKFDLAEEQVKYVVDKQPEDSRAVNMYAYVLAAKEDYKGAVEMQEKFLSMEKEGTAVEQAKTDLEEWKKQIKK